MTVEFGLKLPDHESIVDFAVRAESMGLDYVMQGEHVFFHGPVSNSLIDLSFAAAATTRLKLLSAATLVPLYPPALLAKMTASIAVNSGGRFNLGVGVGGDFAAEFEACGVPTAGRGRATDRALDLMVDLWDGKSIGPFGASETKVTLAPLPPQRVPLWICGRSQATIDRAVRIGDWWMPYLYSIDKFKRDRALLVERSEQAGRPTPRAGLHAFAILGDTHEQALATATHTLNVVYNQSFDTEMIAKLCIFGTSEGVAAKIAAFVEAGAEAACFNLLAAEEEYDERMAQLCADVLPEFRPAGGERGAP